MSPRPAQAGHSLILPTLHCGFGSWAPAQVTDARSSGWLRSPCRTRPQNGPARPHPAKEECSLRSGSAPATRRRAPVPARPALRRLGPLLLLARRTHRRGRPRPPQPRRVHTRRACARVTARGVDAAPKSVHAARRWRAPGRRRCPGRGVSGDVARDEGGGVREAGELTKSGARTRPQRGIPRPSRRMAHGVLTARSSHAVTGASIHLRTRSPWRRPRATGCADPPARPALRRTARRRDDTTPSRRATATRACPLRAASRAARPRGALTRRCRYEFPSRWRRNSASMKASRSPSRTPSTLPVS